MEDIEEEKESSDESSESVQQHEHSSDGKPKIRIEDFEKASSGNRLSKKAFNRNKS
jgi:hypothetical protein